MLQGKVCLVTGASRGIGLGIAIALVKEGGRVYITGRHAQEAGRQDGLVGGGAAAAAAANAAARGGGRCTFVVCDHNDDAAVERAVAAIFADEGRLDLLVNNAFGGQDNGNVATKAIGEPFWRKPLWLWDAAHRVGLRSHYVATVLCARQWEDRGQKGAVVANVSSPGGLDYLFDVAYGVGKAANDRLASDMSVELSGMGVTVCSIWPGAVRTELVAQSAREQAAARAKPKHTAVTAATAGKGVLSKDNMQGVRFGEMESVEFTGRGIAAMLADPQARERWGGRVVLTPELAEWYGFTDTNGKVPWGMLRNMRGGALSRPPPHWRPVAARL